MKNKKRKGDKEKTKLDEIETLSIEHATDAN